MLSALFTAVAIQTQAPSRLEFFGQDVGTRLRRIERAPETGSVLPGESAPGEWVEELFAKDDKGKWRLILVSPSHPALGVTSHALRRTALRTTDSGLFREPPTMAHRFCTPWSDGNVVGFNLHGHQSDAEIVKEVRIPRSGRRVQVAVIVNFEKPGRQIEYFLDSYAFFPDRRRLSGGGKPDSTFSPGLRPRDDQVVGDHFFRAPVISAQKGNLAALMLPDVEVLSENRPMPAILDLDAKNGVVDATLLSYGFADHRLAGHVYFSHDPSMVRKVPKELLLAYDLILDARAEPFGAYRQAVRHTWNWYGKKYFDRVLPQAMPFEEYAKFCYPAAFNEAYGTNKLGWFEVEIDGNICGGIPSGWGFTQGWVSWQCWFNQLRSAWGLKWWGKKLGNEDWVDKAGKMLNLALAAPMDRGACPTTYQSRENKWLGSLIRPREDCYYDLTNMAWKGIWLLRWLEFEDCPRREEILKQCRQMAECMMRSQNEDGSFPTWLTKDFQVVPILDHSAQSALPCWFLTEMAMLELGDNPTDKLPDKSVSFQNAAYKAGEFLLSSVVDQQRYYDFETFFSCSPKKCLQTNGVIDDAAMHDAHTLSPPQNTLCMQWTAEALENLYRLFPGQSRFRASALKALDIMALYQNAWPISYRKTAYTFGGFGVQNSDGEYNDARQAQFGCTLADFGVALGRRDYFERGIAATRAAMTLINHPLHAENGLYPNPNYPPGLQPENCCHGGGDHQAGRTGFDWGEGSGLASMAWLLFQSERTYRASATYASGNWAALIDGGYEGQRHFPKPPSPLQDPAFDFSDWRMKGWTIEGNFAEIPTYSTRLDFGVSEGEAFIGTCEDGRGGYDDGFTGTVTSPSFVVSKPKLKLLVGGGSGEGVYVELIDADGNRLFVVRGRNRERMEEQTWDMSKLKGKTLRIRIVDKETGGWGHINVARIRCAD